ncbi:hypothetical protein SBA3_190013 [Candidatus Sulfopaludibacter sp. SbA3]|nr:hypothetical protein SBA3_190013 [Candidatus Sulfopaludibacter sp. SbA3]
MPAEARQRTKESTQCVLSRFSVSKGKSLEVGAQGADEVLGGAHLFIVGGAAGRKNVESDVTFDDFSHEGIHSSAASRDVVEHIGALGFLIESLLNGGHLPLDAVDPVEQSLLLL